MIFYNQDLTLPQITSRENHYIGERLENRDQIFVEANNRPPRSQVYRVEQANDLQAKKRADGKKGLYNRISRQEVQT